MFFARCADLEIGPFTTYAEAALAAEAELGPVYVIVELAEEEGLETPLAA